MSFPAHQPIHAVHVVMIYSPSTPAAALTAAYCQEVGQKPIFVSILLWPHRGPYPCAEMGKPLNGVCVDQTRPAQRQAEQGDLSQRPSTVSGKREK